MYFSHLTKLFRKFSLPPTLICLYRYHHKVPYLYSHLILWQSCLKMCHQTLSAFVSDVVNSYFILPRQSWMGALRLAEVFATTYLYRHPNKQWYHHSSINEYLHVRWLNIFRLSSSWRLCCTFPPAYLQLQIGDYLTIK